MWASFTKYFNTKQSYFILIFLNLLWAPVVPIVTGSDVNVTEGWAEGRKCTGNGQATNGISILEWRDEAWSCNYENWRTPAVNGKHVWLREPWPFGTLPPLLLLSLTLVFLNILLLLLFRSIHPSPQNHWWWLGTVKLVYSFGNLTWNAAHISKRKWYY